MLFSFGTYSQGVIVQGNISYKHRYDLDLNPQPGGLQHSDLISVPLECPGKFIQIVGDTFVHLKTVTCISLTVIE